MVAGRRQQRAPAGTELAERGEEVVVAVRGSVEAALLAVLVPVHGPILLIEQVFV
jgi:hypothetical protein